MHEPLTPAAEERRDRRLAEMRDKAQEIAELRVQEEEARQHHKELKTEREALQEDLEALAKADDNQNEIDFSG